MAWAFTFIEKDKPQTPLRRDKPKTLLLERLGGDKALSAAVEMFYSRMVADPVISRFFEGVDVSRLKAHQFNFMRLAFTRIPADMDVGGSMLKAHSRLIDMGLDETHFDRVAGIFAGTLTDMGVQPAEVNEAVGVIAPLREVFEKGKRQGRGQVI